VLEVKPGGLPSGRLWQRCASQVQQYRYDDGEQCKLTIGLGDGHCRVDVDQIPAWQAGDNLPALGFGPELTAAGGGAPVPRQKFGIPPGIRGLSHGDERDGLGNLRLGI